MQHTSKILLFFIFHKKKSFYLFNELSNIPIKFIYIFNAVIPQSSVPRYLIRSDTFLVFQSQTKKSQTKKKTKKITEELKFCTYCTLQLILFNFSCIKFTPLKLISLRKP